MFTVDEQVVAYYEPGAGYVWPEAAVAAQLELARAGGAQLQLGERVEAWSVSRHGVTVTTGAATYHGEQLLVCAGAWIADLGGPATGIRFTSTASPDSPRSTGPTAA